MQVVKKRMEGKDLKDQIELRKDYRRILRHSQGLNYGSGCLVFRRLGQSNNIRHSML